MVIKNKPNKEMLHKLFVVDDLSAVDIAKIYKCDQSTVRSWLRKNNYKPKLCKCGCGQMAKLGNKFILGHNQRGVKKSVEHLAKITETKKLNSKNIIKICPWCGNEFEVYPSWDYRIFCSNKCKYADMAIRKVSDKTREKLRENHPRYWLGKKRPDISGDNHCMKDPIIKERQKQNSLRGEDHPMKQMVNRIKSSCAHRGINIEDFDGFIHGDRSHVLYEGQCVLLNERFPGSEGHHITRSIMVFIPIELHRHIRHNLKTGHNMGEINLLALQYINGEL